MHFISVNFITIYSVLCKKVLFDFTLLEA